jgi:metallo-beta-lactamase family protein
MNPVANLAVRARKAAKLKMNEPMKLTFWGGAGTVTGSKYLLSFDNRNVLIDCGLFQGLKSLRLKNWDAFPVSPKQIDAVILTHSHLDHSGLIPKLIQEGFAGPVYCTEATKDLCGILLPDSGYLMEEEAFYLNKHKKSKHHPALPLYTEQQAEQALQSFIPVAFDQTVKLFENFEFKFHMAGHILGAAQVEIYCRGKRILFTGDLGRSNDPILREPALIQNTDYLILESTYGNRQHSRKRLLKQHSENRGIEPEDFSIKASFQESSEEASQELADFINKICTQKKGVLLIPAFAVGRVQTLMFYIWKLKQEHKIPHSLPIYLDSPMASDASNLLNKYSNLHRLNKDVCEQVCKSVSYIKSQADSKKLDEQKESMVVISASGMLSGGRVLHHLKAFGPNPKNGILLTGFQAAGTRGEALQNGASELKIHGSYHPIEAEVKSISSLSAHADCIEIIEWLKKCAMAPKLVFITHGEPSASDELRRRLRENFNWEVAIPQIGEAWPL